MTRQEAILIKSAINMLPLAYNGYNLAWYKMTEEAKQGILNIVDSLVESK